MTKVLGIDLGTQSLKTLIYDTDKRCITASVSAPVDLIQKSDGTAEQVASWWVAALDHCMAELPAVQKKEIMAISVSGQQHGFVPVDAEGAVLANVKLWCDTTTIQECEDIMMAVGGRKACVALGGNAILTGYTAPKILWLKQYHPKAYEAMATVMLPHDYLNFFLGGVRAMEYGDASGTGLLDVKSRQWHPQLVDAIDNSGHLKKCLPPLHDGLEAIGRVSDNIAERYGFTSGIAIAPGGGDNMMGAIGTGNVRSGVVTISLGSSGTVYASSSKPLTDPAERLAAFCSSTGGWLPLLCTMNCTLTTELTRICLDTPLQELEALVSASPIGSDGVLTLPFFNGERTPNLPQGKGNILGLDATNYSKANLLRSAMEGASFGLKLGIEALQENGLNIEEIRLIGGGSKSPTWCQMMADICNTSVVLLKEDEGAAFGAALQAYATYRIDAGQPVNIEQLASEHVELDTQQYHPNPQNVGTYAETYSRYKQAVEVISTLYK